MIPMGHMDHFDFNEYNRIFFECIQLKVGNGYDHCFVISNQNGKLKKIGSV